MIVILVYERAVIWRRLLGYRLFNPKVWEQFMQNLINHIDIHMTNDV